MKGKKLSNSLRLFLEEDAFDKDVTTGLIPERNCTAEIMANEDCVLAGAKEAKELFESQGLELVFSRKDGEECSQGEVIMQLKGSNKALFSSVRSALNLLGRMSGVATQCHKAEEIAKRYGVKTAVTRKTLPGLREYDKRAAKLGGSWPHRKDLSEMVLLKKQHLAYFKSIDEAAQKAKKTGKKVEVEAKTLEEAVEAARAKADIVMLDNFSIAEAGNALKKLREYPIKVELSGGISLENLEGYARLKPDIISMGCLTKAADSVDFSVRVIS